jgi:hypothetical protein
MTWIKVADEKPPMDKPIMVLTGEFGFTPAVAIARMWQSSLPDQPMKFYLDNETYPIVAQYCIAEQVVAWQPIPKRLEAQWAINANSNGEKELDGITIGMAVLSTSALQNTGSDIGINGEEGKKRKK